MRVRGLLLLLGTLMSAFPAGATSFRQREPAQPPFPQRFRLGISGLIVPIPVPPVVAGGLEGRFGRQFSERFALYAQPLVFAGETPIYNGFAPEAQPIFSFGSGVLFEITLKDRVFAALGPEAGLTVLYWYGAATERPYFGWVARVGGYPYATGDRFRREGFSVALELRQQFYLADGESSYFPGFSLGYEAF